jgi:IclR family transcriptional regulator, acetate operon repressor
MPRLDDMAQKREKAASPVGEARPRSGVQVISRVARILQTVAAEPAGLSLAEITVGTGLAKSTVYRMLLALESEGLLETRNGDYRIGGLLSRSAMSPREQIRLRVRPSMERLAAQLHETVDLSVLAGNKVLFIDQVRWDRELTAGIVIGDLYPTHSCASGKALLAGSMDLSGPDAALGHLERLTPNTVTEPDDLRAQLLDAQHELVTYDHEENHIGICGLATWMIAPDGAVVGVGIPVPTVRFAARLDELKRGLLAARPLLQNSL